MRRASAIRWVREASLLVVCLGTLAGCDPASTDVQDLGGGTYRVGARYAQFEDQDKALSDALRRGDKFCQSKGQKLQTVPNPGSSDILFRCVGADEAPPAEGQSAN